VRILSPIVLAQALLMASRQSNFGLCSAVGAQFVRHSTSGAKPCFLSSLRISFMAAAFAPSPHQQIENLAFVGQPRAKARTAGPQSSRPSR
jgi:hypothetical protein